MRNTFKALFAVLIVGSFIMQTTSADAYWNGHNGGGYGHGGGYSHGGGHWGGYGRSYVGVNFSVWPDNYYYGAPYYPVDGVLVSQPVDDPVIVQQPVTVIQQPETVVTQAQPVAPVITAAGTTGDTTGSMTINIPNNKGGYTAVTLKESGNGFIGPQGEFYPTFPKVAQLEVIYGK